MWEDESFEGMDDDMREHFRFLKGSLGHNFNSILNDPRESIASDWTERLGSGMMQLFDKSSAWTDESLVASLAPLNNLNRAHVVPYLTLVGQYESALTTASAPAAQSPITAEDIPQDFYDVGFDVHASRVVDHQFPYLTMREDFDFQSLRRVQMWLKAVEDTLLRHVQSRSMDFFASLQEFREVQIQVETLLGRISSLRGVLSKVDESCVQDAVAVRQAFQQRQKLIQIEDLLNEIAAVRDATVTIHSLLSVGQYVDAVEVYQHATSALATRLQGVEALSNLKMEFAEVRTNMVMVMTDDLQRYLVSPSGSVSLLDPVVRALVAMDAVTQPIMAYRSVLVQQLGQRINETMVATLRSFDIGTDTVESSVLATLQKLRNAQFSTLISNVFKTAEMWLEPTLRVLTELMTAIQGSATATCGVMQLQGVMESLQETRPALLSHVQTRVAKIFDVRSEENAGLRFVDMESLLRSSFAFARRCETLFGTDAGPTTGQLRATLITQARAFFKKQHEKQKQKITMVLAQEQWTPEQQVEGVFQRSVSTMVDNSPGAVQLALTRGVENAQVLTSEAAVVNTEEFTNKLMLRGRGYTVGNSMLILIQGLAEYERCICAMPFLGNDIIQSMHDLLRLYLSQCVAMILGGGAIASGLESIGAVHLALGAQSVDFMAGLGGALGARLALILPTKLCVFLKTFEKFEKDAKAIRNEFYMKVISMAMERVDLAPVPDPTAWRDKGNAWVMSMLKELTKIMRTLKPILDRFAMKMVVCPVLHQCNFRIRMAIQKMAEMALFSDAALRQAVWEDVLLFKINLEKFGHSVTQGVRCGTLLMTEAEAMQSEPPPDSDKDVRDYFFGKL